MALQAGKNTRWIADQLGHSDPSLTLRVYAHSMPEAETDLSFADFGDPKRPHPAPEDEEEIHGGANCAEDMVTRARFERATCALGGQSSPRRPRIRCSLIGRSSPQLRRLEANFRNRLIQIYSSRIRVRSTGPCGGHEGAAEDRKKPRASLPVDGCHHGQRPSRRRRRKSEEKICLFCENWVTFLWAFQNCDFHMCQSCMEENQ